MHPFHYFDKVFIINLPSRTDRLREMDAQLRIIGLGLDAPMIELFPALRPSVRGEFDSVGARGCFMSHMSVLKKAAEMVYERILILEDDVNFVPDFMNRLSLSVESLSNQHWNIFYGGYRLDDDSDLLPGIPDVAPDRDVKLTHFIAFQSPAIRTAAGHLETLVSRPGGDPRGGPMHVDGAYFWFRRMHPHFTTRVAVPQLGYQRASRTDIHALRWFDRLTGARQLTAAVRALKNRSRNR
jgi:hypothetical protein